MERSSHARAGGLFLVPPGEARLRGQVRLTMNRYVTISLLASGLREQTGLASDSAQLEHMSHVLAIAQPIGALLGVAPTLPEPTTRARLLGDMKRSVETCERWPRSEAQSGNKEGRLLPAGCSNTRR